MKAVGKLKHAFEKEQPDREMSEKSKSIYMLLSLDTKMAEAPPEFAGVYLIAVRDETAETVRIAVERFIQGRVENHNPSFLPKPPELARECRRIAAPQEAFDKVWRKPQEKNLLETPEVVHLREVAADRAKTPEERADAINKIRKKHGQPPLDFTKKVKLVSRKTGRKTGETIGAGPQKFEQFVVGDAAALVAALDKNGGDNDRQD